MSIWLQLLIVCPMLFLAGFADSIAGGGGIISLQAQMMAGLPIHMAYGTNKFAMSLGTTMSTFQYAKSGNIRWKPALFAAGGALIGANLGAQLAMLLDEKYLSYCLMVLLPAAAIFLMCNRKFGSEEHVREVPMGRQYVLSAFIGLVVGAYDGFFGPGAGTFYVLLFTSLLGYDLLSASGNAKVVNLASNIGALVAYIIGGKVMYIIGIPAAFCTVAGNYVGSKLAIKNGSKFIRPVMAVVILLLFVKIILDLVQPAA